MHEITQKLYNTVMMKQPIASEKKMKHQVSKKESSKGFSQDKQEIFPLLSIMFLIPKTCDGRQDDDCERNHFYYFAVAKQLVSSARGSGDRMVQMEEELVGVRSCLVSS